MAKLKRFVDLFLWRLHKCYKDPLEVAHDFLEWVCSDPLQTNIFAIIVGNIFRIYIVLLGGLSLINLFHAHDIWEFATTIEGFTVALQSINDQVLCLLLYHKEILLLVEQRKRFWDPVKVDPKDESGSQRKLQESIKALNIFGVFMICLGIVYTVYCICLSMPPISYWLPQDYTSLQTVMMVTQVIWFEYSCISVFAFNSLFIGFCVNMCVQYRLIAHKLENMAGYSQNTKEMKQEIKNLIEHHIFVLEFSHLVKDTFSLHFLLRIVETVGMMCVTLYIASDKSSTLYQTSRSGQLCCTLILQFSLDCYISHDVVTDALKVRDAAYNSEWYSSPVLASYIKMIIIRATKPVALTAGRIIEVNKQTMTSVLKTTFSYLTALKTLDAE